MTPEVTKTVLNKRLDRKWTSIIIWPRDRASISVYIVNILLFFKHGTGPRGTAFTR
jgi:hypothetical protein